MAATRRLALKLFLWSVKQIISGNLYMGYYHLSPLRRVLVVIDAYHVKSKMAGNNSVAIVNIVTLRGPLSYTSQKP